MTSHRSDCLNPRAKGGHFFAIAAAMIAFGALAVGPADAQTVKKEILTPSWEAKYTFSPAVITEGGKTVWLAGHVGFLDDNNKPLNGDFDAQVRETFKNMQKTLAKAGGTLNDIVTMMVFISDGRYSKRFTDLRGEFYAKDYPASTLIVAAGFALPEIMVEITATAVVGK
jgi:2-iminobutanoate/2-iminopropanoate deaminase